MNYYEHHIGDFAKDAGYLSMVEEGAYRRLIDVYYAREEALPAEVKACCKLARATSKPERDAVAYVLEEFFTLEADGWHQKRCDEEIEAYQAGEPEREEARVNKDTRLKRHRAERSAMFEALRQVGETPAWNIRVGELRSLLQRHGIDPRTLAATAGDNGAETKLPPLQQPLPVTAPATPASATHTPIPSSHVTATAGTTHTTVARDDAEPPTFPPGVCTPAGLAAAALNRAGVRVTSQNPNLIAAMSEGVTAAALLELHRAYPDKPAGYLIAAARRQHADAPAPITPGAPHATPGRRLSAVERVEANIRANRIRRGELTPDDAIDGEATRVAR